MRESTAIPESSVLRTLLSEAETVHPVCARRRRRDLLDLEHLRAAGAANANRLHDDASRTTPVEVVPVPERNQGSHRASTTPGKICLMPEAICG